MEFKLPDLPFVKLNVVFKALDDCTLPPFKGSMLRGAFGHALKRIVCLTKENVLCKNCKFARNCIFTKVFETLIFDDPPPFLKGVVEAPKPFIFDSDSFPLDLTTGDFFNFKLILIGNSSHYHPHIIFALDNMARFGLTAKRQPFELFSVTCKDERGNDKLVYNGENQCLQQVCRTSINANKKIEHSKISIDFLSPTRIKHRNNYVDDFSFRTLVFKMIRRNLELAFFHAPDSNITWEFKELLQQADNIKVIDKNFEWLDYTRYSNRQQKKMEYGGIVGKMVLQGDLELYSDILTQSETVFVGKGTSFGFGKIKVKGHV